MMRNILLPFLCWSLLGLPAASNAASITSDADNQLSILPIACSPEKPLVKLGETIAVRAWAVPTDNHPLYYDWSVTGGRVEGKSEEVRWDFTGVKPDVYVATVKIGSASMTPTECSVHVVAWLEETAKGDVRHTGRTFLIKGQQEESGYGLYSYLLLNPPANAAQRDRCLMTIKSTLEQTQDVSRYEEFRKRHELNVAYIPVTAKPDKDALGAISRSEYEKLAQWVLDHYDFVRADVVLRAVPGSHNMGPYFVGYTRPLSKVDHVEGKFYLFNDLSPADPDLAWAWVREFLSQAAQEAFWDEQRLKHFALRLRTTVRRLSEGRKAVQDSLSILIKSGVLSLAVTR